MIDKNVYSSPVCKLVYFAKQDVVRTSGGGEPEPEKHNPEEGFGDIFGTMN